MSKTKKIIALLLALVLCFSVAAVPVSAASPETLSASDNGVQNFFYMVIDRLIQVILSFLNQHWPGYQVKWDNAEDYVAEHFYKGEDSFDTEVKPDSSWKLGYASDSIIKGLDIMNGKFFLAGSLEPVAGRAPTEVLDDQKVRVYALSDNVSGTVVHAVIDGFGLSRGNVEEIRARLDEFAKANDIVSINVSVLHQHSCIDTLGMNVPLAPALILNTGNAATGGKMEEFMVKKNPEFMESLFSKTVNAVKNAVKDMRDGDLYFGNVDVNELIHDKREPIVFDGNLNRLRFVPADGSKETWIVQGAIHCVSIGVGTDKLSSDYPYYMEQVINEKAGANFVFIQGAELAITSDASSLNLPEDISRVDRMIAYGKALGEKVLTISNDVKLDPVLNIKHEEIRLDVDNCILTLAAREELLDAIIVKNGTDSYGNTKYQMVTEIGYMELGNKVAALLTPGELDPVILLGGATTPDQSWTGESWDYAPLKDYSGLEYVLVFGLCNDQAGYILTDNEYHSLLCENEEVNIVSRTSGSTITQSFIDLIGSVK